MARGSGSIDPEASAAIVRALAEAGATWWVEADWWDGSVSGLCRRIAAGPPRVEEPPTGGQPPAGGRRRRRHRSMPGHAAIGHRRRGAGEPVP